MSLIPKCPFLLCSVLFHHCIHINRTPGLLPSAVLVTCLCSPASLRRPRGSLVSASPAESPAFLKLLCSLVELPAASPALTLWCRRRRPRDEAWGPPSHHACLKLGPCRLGQGLLSWQIQSFSDSFEQQLCFRTKRSVSLGPESRKERNERERPFLEVRSCKKVEEKRSSRKEEHGEVHLPTLSEKALK